MRSHADTDLPLTIDSPETAESSNSLAHVMGVLRRYAGVIAVSVLAVAFLYLIVAIAVYVFGEAQQVTSLPFRVVFEGADAGTYPNGLKFNSSEIVATPVLQRVYTASNLSRFIGFSELKSRVFVLEANKDLDRLSLEYQAKLAEPRLSPMERDRLEKEYDLKKESLRRAEYSLNMALDDDTKSIPRGLRSEVLNSILRTWGEQAMQEKGAGMYRIPMLSRNIFAADTSLQSLDYVVAVDVLRSKANRVISTIDQLLRVPGSEVVRTGAEQTTLPEIRSNLEDIVRYRIEPLIAKVRAYRLSKQPGEADRFLQSQLESARRARDQRRGAVAALQNSLELYMQRGSGGQQSGDAQKTQPTQGQTLIPQIDKSFLEQIVDLAAQQRDLEYRQKLLDELNKVTLSELLPAEREVAYYEQLMASGNGSRVAPPPNAVEMVSAEYGRSREQALRAVDQVMQVYRLVSQNLNPGSAVYNVTDPPKHFAVRAYSARKLGMIGVLVVLVSLPLIIIACFMHNRLREEKADETRLTGITA